MQREIDAIQLRDGVIGAGFAATAAALATAAGVYSLWKGDDADSRVSATLGLGAGASTVPTFFYLGGDKRTETLKQRMNAIDDGRTSVSDAYKRLEESDRNFDRAQRQTTSDPAELARAREERQRMDDALNDALMGLDERCR
jgi:hypothetical protein